MLEQLLSDMRQSLKNNIDEKTLNSGQRYFKEKIKLYGVKTSIVKAISEECYRSLKDEPKDKIFDLCEELWKSGYTEETYVACYLSQYISEQYKPSDFKIFDKWVNTYVNNWASCDSLCNHSVGDFLEMYPEYIHEMKKWAKSDNRWVRRAAAVSLILPARKGLFLKDIFEIADLLFSDKDDLVQKGYGWMLKAASEAFQKEVFDYVMRNKKTMPRTSLRYAIEKMPADLKAKAMEK